MPNVWYAECHEMAIVQLIETHYLCSVITSHCEVRRHLGKEQALCARFALILSPEIIHLKK